MHKVHTHRTIRCLAVLYFEKKVPAWSMGKGGMFRPVFVRVVDN